MHAAGRIFGDEVSSTAPVFLAFLAVHVLSGMAAVLTGAITAALTRKGSRIHVRIGRVFYRAITVVFVSGTALAAMRPREDWYLFLIGAVAYTGARTGVQHRRRRRPGDTVHIIGMGMGYVAMLTAFYVDNGPQLPMGSRLPTVAFWLLPTAIGAPIVSLSVMRRARRARSIPETREDTRGQEYA